MLTKCIDILVCLAKWSFMWSRTSSPLGTRSCWASAGEATSTWRARQGGARQGKTYSDLSWSRSLLPSRLVAGWSRIYYAQLPFFELGNHHKNTSVRQDCFHKSLFEDNTVYLNCMLVSFIWHESPEQWFIIVSCPCTSWQKLSRERGAFTTMISPFECQKTLCIKIWSLPDLA